MSKISIVSNLQCTSIFIVRVDDRFASVLVWEQGSRTQQFNFHALDGCRNAVAARARAGVLNCNLDAVMRRMRRCDVPHHEQDAFYEAFSDTVDGWVSDWFINHFDEVYQVGDE